MTDFTVDPATLERQITGLVPDGGRHIRQSLLDQVEGRLPRDPESRINIELSELNPCLGPASQLDHRRDEHPPHSVVRHAPHLCR